jgi:ABC-type lipoprotein export system ATPase subunit
MTVGERVLFSGLSFTVAGGELAALMGPSGVGKSTLLAGIAELAPIAEGAILHELELDEDRWASNGPQTPKAHWMFQSSPLLTRRSAVDNVALSYELQGLDRDAALDASLEVLESLGLGTVARQAVHRLSGGERQRVAVARALASRPRLLLADEPTASLDADTRSMVTGALVQVARGGAAVLVATHDRWVADQCDKIIELQGRTPWSGDVDDAAEVNSVSPGRER